MKIYLDGQRDAGRRPAVRALLRRRARPVQLPDALLRPDTIRAARARTCTSPSRTRSRARSWPSTGWGDYYQFTYTTYPKGTKLPTFSADLAEEDAAALAAGERLPPRSTLGTDPAGAARGTGDRPRRRSASLGGKTASVLELTGPRAITAIRGKMTFARTARTRWRPLRQLVLRDHVWTARRSRRSGARWAISSARPRA